jgi:hypothetical protein
MQGEVRFSEQHRARDTASLLLVCAWKCMKNFIDSSQSTRFDEFQAGRTQTLDIRHQAQIFFAA